MKLIINKNRTTTAVGTWGTKNENDYEILEFEFPAELEEYNKRIVYYLDNERVWDIITDNKAYITNAVTQYEKVKAYVWLTKENTEREADTDFRTKLFEMKFYDNDNADGIVPTEQQIDGFNTMLTAMNRKIDEVNALEQTILQAETERQENENTRISNESTRQSNESTRETNEQTRQSQEAERERRTDEAIGNIEDKTAEYNANAEAKTNEFNQNATQKTNDFNSNYTQKVNDFNTNATTQESAFNSNASLKTSAFNSNAETKTNAFNTNATNKTNVFNSNVSEKTTAFDNNASTKTSEFNTNAESKTSVFNDNATQKTTNFDNNASEKTDEFNTNAQNKIDEYDEHIVDYQAQIDELQEEVDELSENMPWNTTEQATEISVDDAAKYSRNKLEIFGNTSQDSTTGKNLANLSILNQVPSTTNGELVTFGGGVCTELIEIDNTKDIVFSFSQTESRQKYVMFYGENQNYLGYSIGMQTNWLLSKNSNYSNSKYVRIRFDNKATTNWCQLEYNSTATDYEPYTGGQPSPNPDYPQDIHVVTGNNSIEVQGENLIFNNLTSQTINGVTFVVNPDKSVTINGTASATTQINLLTNTIGEADEITLPAGTYTLQGCPTGGSSATYKLDITNNGSAIITDYGNNVYSRTFTDNFVFDRVRIVLQSGTTVSNLTFKPMLVKGNTNVPYVPYVEPQNYPINLGSIELCKIGNYQDYLYKENGNWYKYGAIEKKIFDGTEGWAKSSTTNYDRFVNGTLRNITGQLIGLCTHLKYNAQKTGLYTFWLDDSVNLTYRGRIVLDFSEYGATTLADFKTWLATNEPKFYIPFATPTTTQITDETLISQLDAIYEHLKLVKGTNNITVTAEDLAPYMELEYMQDLKSKLDNIDSRLSLLE